MLFRILVLTGWLAIGSPVWAQQASISGFVRDTSGAVIANAKISIQNLGTNTQLATETNGEGVYTFATLAPGVYRLTVEAQNFEKKAIDNLRIETAGKLLQNIELKVGAVNAQVTIEESGINVNTSDGAVSTVINRRFVENIPLNGRSFQSLLTIVPGVTAVPSNGVGASGGISVNGQRTEANYFTVDGVSANTGLPPTGTPGFGAGYSGSTPGETALGTTQSLVSIDALQEFRASSSTYSAEFGRTPGGQFSFTTRSGTNDWRGSIFNYFRNDVFDANNFFSNATQTPKPATRQNDFGGTLGGPIIKDKTFFFFSYEGLRLRTPQAGITTQVPSASLRQNAAAAWRPILNAFPMPNGADLGNGLANYTAGYSNPSSINTTSIRLDHHFSERLNLFGRYHDAPSENTTRMLTNLAETLSYEFGTRTATVGATYLINSRLSNDLRFNFSKSKSNSIYESTSFGGATPFALSEVPGFGSSPYNRLNVGFLYGLRPSFSLLNQTAGQNQINLVETMNLSFGRHTFKFGFDYRRTSNYLYFPPLFMPINIANQNELINNNVANFNLVAYSLEKLQPIYKNFSAFVQDEWKVNSRLNLSLGLRWEVNPPPGDANHQLPYTVDQINDLRTTKLAPQNTPLWKTTYNNFAPRIGVAYRLGEKPGFETVVRGGFGVYYDLGNTQASDGYGRVGFRVTRRFTSAFPLTQAQLASVPAPNLSAPYSETVLTDDPNLKLPYTWQWNVAVEQTLKTNQTLSLSYVGALGRRLLLDRSYAPASLGNANFGTAGLVLTTNLGESSYHALQTQFQRRLARGLQAIASYTWSHSIDNATSNFTVRQFLRGSSDFDIRHNLQTALSYDIPGQYDNPVASALLKYWAIDGRISARSALPVNIIGSTGFDPLLAYIQVDFQPNLVIGQPLYIDDATAPGGRRFNFAAFTAAPAGQQGNFGRNVLRGFNAAQTDLALRREFPIGERFKIQFRAESFNIFNRANFGAIYNQLTNGAALFGRAYTTQNAQLGGLNSLYQVGGPRSFQFALKLLF